jgi:tetratricopeptide (TPR) repeat protein
LRRPSSIDRVAVWEETIVIPTYPAPAADLNPMFLEKRVYQGSSGKVYPNPFTDRISDEKLDRTYRAVFLENEYVKVMVLPEIGGRIHRGLDKTNNYDFFYHQRVIKPALVGLLGPWISGGVEFNWPQHHRPSTFMPVDHCIERHPDGSATVWLSEHEPMNRMKGMHGIRLYPGKSFVEACVNCYNRTLFPQTLLWWANAAVHVREEYQAFFPPDVTWVADHAKRAVSEFPVARGFYYGVDYTRGVDIRWWGNIPVPTSYMVMHSEYEFAGGYDHRRRAGVVHVADRRIAPGKKVWTWGCGEFGKAWERELTDEDGPYFELMAGVFTDNQPDFSWLHPLETRTFRQCWYPIREIGVPRNANRDGAVSLEVQSGQARIGVHVTKAQASARVTLTRGGHELFSKIVDLAPGSPFLEQVPLPKDAIESGLHLIVRDHGGRELVQYLANDVGRGSAPSPATEPPPPHQIGGTDELYVVGLHLEQYRHATRSPRPYWEEALRRDPGDARNNNALGVLELRRGRFADAEQHFKAAIGRLTARNPNPYDGEPYYNLGLALKLQHHESEAYEAFSKATWNYAWHTASHFALAQIDCARGAFAEALEHLAEALARDPRNTKVRNLYAAVLRRLGRFEDAEASARKTSAGDLLDFWSRNELVLAASAQGRHTESRQLRSQLSELMHHNVQTYLDVAFDYADAGLFDDATNLLEQMARTSRYPMLLYALGFFHAQRSDGHRSAEYYAAASQAPSDYCFPSRLAELIVLEHVQEANPLDARAFYYLGNLLYDKQRYEDAIRNWERSCELDPHFSIPWRNLGIAYFNVHGDAKGAAECYAKAFAANPRDARLLYEMDQLDKRIGVPPQTRLLRLEQHLPLVDRRDDLTVERATLYNQTGQSSKALEVLRSRRFHPWEGGEGLVSGQYVWTHVILGHEAFEAGNFDDALGDFEAAQHYPENLGEGKHLLTPENHLHYFAGLVRKRLGDSEGSRELFQRAAAEEQPLASPTTYYRALAARELGQGDAAQRLLEELLDAATLKRQAPVTIDYFATSLPNFLLFEDDLQKRSEIECLFLIGLAQRGLGRSDEAETAFREAFALDVNHLGAQQQLRWLRSAVSAP